MDTSKEAVVNIVDKLIRQGVQRRASDVHLDPTEDGHGRVRLRIDGVLHDVDPLPAELLQPVVDRLKIMSGMDADQGRMPQDGRITIKLDAKPYDLRTSLIPTVLGERIVCRILSPEAVVLELDAVGLEDDQLEVVRGFCHTPHGVVVVDGPTGCGKTTLLYCMIMEIDRDKESCMTVEDPVEYMLPGVAQTQVNAAIGLTFARAMRSFLRQDPDVIMVGEIRDAEVLNACAQAALTGHLVLTTLHAGTAAGAVKRMLDVGLQPFLLNSCLSGVTSQRLIRRLCPECKQATEPALDGLPEGAAEFVRAATDVTFHGPVGCEACYQTGYRGRTGIHEVLVPDDGVRHAVAASADAAVIEKAAIAAGMRPMLLGGLAKAARGITSIQEVCRVAPRGEW